MALFCYNPEFHFIKLDNTIAMRYARLGTPGAPLVIMIHGATDSYLSFSQIAPAIAEAGYDVFVPELRGHGGSDKPEGDYSVKTLAEDMNFFMEKLGLTNAYFVGHSLGTFISQEMALSYPDKIAAATLIGTSAKLIANPTLEWLMDGDGEDFHGATNFVDTATETFAADWTSSDNEDPEFITLTYHHAVALPAYVWTGIFSGIQYLDNSISLRDVKIPLQIIWGTEDAFFDYGEQIHLINSLYLCPNVTFQKKRGKGHNTHWESGMAVEIAEDILKHLR